MIATLSRRLLSLYVKYHCGCHLCLISIQFCFVSIITDDALSVQRTEMHFYMDE